MGNGALAKLARLVDESTLVRVKLCRLIEEGIGTERVEKEAMRWQKGDLNYAGQISKAEAKEKRTQDGRGPFKAKKMGVKGGDNLRDERKVLELMALRVKHVKERENENRHLYKVERKRLRIQLSLRSMRTTRTKWN